MVQKLIDRIQAKLELFRLEQRYTRRRNRRSTFVSNAIYVDGEYIYQTPNNTGSSVESTSTRIDALHGEKMGATSTRPTSTFITTTADVPSPDRKRLNRFSSVPGFGGISFNKDRTDVSTRRTSTIQW
ncbi:hypothetical protein Golomagni_06564 [Golovinomyces magnicellulatus]|nr:hypothetical protein Golomagni_06564 [Golovinomyces magnicellulatus]